jgi:hypothetical protein
MTNFGELAILALPGLPERQLRVLLVLETVSPDEDGWRSIGLDLLARQAGRSAHTVVKARDELAAAGLIEYRPGTGPNHPSLYRLRFAISNPGKNAATVKRGKNAATVNPGKPAPGTVAMSDFNRGSRNAATSPNANTALEPLALESSALRGTPADLNGRAGSAPSTASGGSDDDSSGTDDPGAAAPPRQAPRLAHAWDDQPAEPGYGQCPDCGRWITVNLGGGRLVPHHGRVYGRECPG